MIVCGILQEYSRTVSQLLSTHRVSSTATYRDQVARVSGVGSIGTENVMGAESKGTVTTKSPLVGDRVSYCNLGSTNTSWTSYVRDVTTDDTVNLPLRVLSQYRQCSLWRQPRPISYRSIKLVVSRGL
jgi:hypothetical protein